MTNKSEASLDALTVSELADTVTISEPLEELQIRHKRELKELTARMTALKKTATKGDKKRKKEVQGQIAKLESDIRTRHDSELKQYEALHLNEKTSSGIIPIANKV